ncbi:hypothetical protein BHM03_00038574 [Ensete ventricosum]|nr:hypothetical protein BHM03_00038574 [Ensete ventricosum]
MGSRPYGRHRCPRAAPRGRVVPPYAGAAPAGAHSCHRPPLQAAAVAAGLPLAASPRAATPAGASHARGRLPCKGLWPWPTTPDGGLAKAGRPYGGPGRSQPTRSSLRLLQKRNKNA